MWSVEWMNLFGKPKNREFEMGPRPERPMSFVELRNFLGDYLNQQQEASAQLARDHYLGIRALLRDIRDSQGHISHQMEKIMSVISDFGAAMNAYFDETGAGIDELKGTVANLAGDVAGMKAKIDELQNSPGAITPEDQKILNDLQARAVSASANAKDAVAQAKALDEATPPVVPPEVLAP